MKKVLALTLFGLFYQFAFCGNNISTETGTSTILHKSFPPSYDSASHSFRLRNENARFGRKFLRGSLEVAGYNMFSMALLFALPERVSNWHSPKPLMVKEQYHHSFSHSPAFDPDAWYINYLGHPYQGACYYNAVRSQGATFWQAGLFCLGHSLIWEYVAEGGLEQPSIQDLVVTPFVGSLLGELIHHGTILMSRNGFKWYEKVFVCLFNPLFAINNGFKYAYRKTSF